MARELTIEDLMKMDGQWVWCEYIGDFKLKSMYHVVDVRKRLLRELDNDDEWGFDNIGDDIKVYDKNPDEKQYLTDLEMIAKLRENPMLRAVIAEPKYEGTYAQFKDGVLRWYGHLQDGQEAFVTEKSKQWEIINPSVTWQEALRALADRKMVSWVKDQGTMVFNGDGWKEIILPIEALRTGEWYIEE